MIRKKEVLQKKKCIDSVQLHVKRGRKVGQIEVISWRRGEVCVWEEGGELETSDAQLGVQAGGWES